MVIVPPPPPLAAPLPPAGEERIGAGVKFPPPFTGEVLADASGGGTSFHADT